MGAHRKRLAGNFISLSLVQGLSILFPLITFPYLIRVLGIEGFGIFTLIQTSLMYFDLLVSFGFGLTATQQVSHNTTNVHKIKEIIISVYIIKLLLLLLSVIIFLGCCIFIPYLREHFILVLISPLYLLGNLLFPDWYFQGIQKMRNITFVALVSKLISFLLIILLVKNSGDISYAVLSMSAGNLIAGLIGFFIMVKTIPFKLEIPSRDFIVSMFRESSYVFTSIILAPLYTSLNIFILQLFTNPLMVGYYAIAEKICSAVAMFTNIANRTFYPHLSQLYVSSVAAYKKNVQSVLKLFFAGFLVFSLLQFFAAEQIVHLIAGKKSNTDLSYAVDILKIMSIGLFFSPYASFFFQLLVIQGHKKRAARNIFITVMVNLFTACFFAYFYSGKGMAVNYCIVIFLISILNYTSYSKKIAMEPLNSQVSIND
ncbi:oligosaccharide flippase family protein [soil metagenome]